MTNLYKDFLAVAKTPYFIGIIWFLLSLLISNGNDLIMKFLGQNLHSVEIIFWRFLFGTLSLIPFMLFFGRNSWKSERPLVHIIRGVLLFAGITLWCYGLTIVPIATATVLNFSIPLFTLVLAYFFLRENIGWPRLVATIIGFLGVITVLGPTAFGFQVTAFVLVFAAFLFAMLDIINKKFIVKETMLGMLFYSALVTTVLSAIPTYYVWHTPTLQQLGVLAALGVGANLLLYCLLKAFSLMDASALAPFRYFELVLSVVFGFLIFEELPGWGTALGTLIIIPSTFFVARYELKRRKKKKELANASDASLSSNSSPKKRHSA